MTTQVLLSRDMQSIESQAKLPKEAPLEALVKRNALNFSTSPFHHAFTLSLNP